MPSVFLSYSHKDEAWKNRLKTHLGVLEAQGLLDTWDDHRIEGGAEWFEEIQEAMARASVAVLLVSADFMTSKFILGEEVPRLLQRRTAEGLPIFPVVVQTCAWDQVEWLKGIQIRPKDGRALASFRGDRRNEELAKIAREILGLTSSRKIEIRDAGREREITRNEDEFLDRVEAVCRLREPESDIQSYPGIGDAGGYLRIMRRVGDFRDTYPVGAIEHGISRESFQNFLEEIDAPYRKSDPGMISLLVYGGAPAPVEVVTEARAKRVRLVSFVEHQGLIDFRTYLGRQTLKLAEDPIYPPRLYVSQRMRTLSLLGREDNETADALAQVREWLDSPHGRFLVLLGDFGTGKTFLLHELARRIGEAAGGLVPILLQMRSLEKGRSLDALLAQHFAQEGMEGFSPARFRYMLEQGRIALLFDGFDELALRVTYAKAADHFATLLQAATGSAKVVLTSRRQHFLSESQVKTALAERVESLSGHRLAILQPFHREQVRLFLANFFTGDEIKADARLDLIDRVKDLLGLSSNPRLLGFIAELPEDQLVAASQGGEITAAKLYELLLTRWLEYEFDRVHPKGAPPGLSIAERWQAVNLLAMRLWQKTDRFMSLSDLSEEAARVLQTVGPAAPDAEVAAFQVGSGTLLVRDDEGNFAFLHQSILEWLVAKSAAEALAAEADPEALKAREISPLMADFFTSLAGRERSVAWARGVFSASAGETAKRNALLVLERLKETIREGLSLAYQDLRGQDLSGQDLSTADLSGADLTAARLVGTRLISARLVQAILYEADLGASLLIRADFTEANLTGARLAGADLRGARLTKAIFRRTKLIGAALDADSLESADSFGAAVDLSELRPECAATGDCQAVVWSPDGALLASTAGNVIRLWEAHNGREIRSFCGHQSWVRSLAFSPNGETLASGSDDKTIRLWQVGSGREIRAMSGHQSWVRALAFSPDGKMLASGAHDQTVRLWQIDSGREVRSLRGQRDWVRSLAFSPDGKTLASGSDRIARLWHVESGREIQSFSGHKDWVRSVDFSPDGRTLATGSHDQTVRLWQVDSGREIWASSGDLRPISAVAFSPDGNILATGSEDQIVRLWQVNSGREIRAWSGHQGTVWSVAFSPDGQTLATGSEDRTVRLWQVGSGREIRAFGGHPSGAWSVAFSPDDKTLAIGSEDRTIRLWQVDRGHEIRVFSGHRNRVRSVVFSPDGKIIASSSADQTVRLWQMDGGEIQTLSGHQGQIWTVAFSPDGKTLATGSEDQTIRLWRVDSGREIRSMSGHQGTVRSVAFSPDGKMLASGSSDQSVRLWQVGTGRKIRTLHGHRRPILSVVFSPDGKTLASGSTEPIIRLWQVEGGREIRSLSGHQDGVRSVLFSSDGKTLVTGSFDQTVRVWQVDSGREIRTLSGHQNVILSLAISPDGNTLASGSEDGTVRLWDITDGRCLAVFLPLPEGWVAFSPDGRYKVGGVPAGGFWHAANLCRFEIGELDEWVPGLRLEDDASFFDLPPWKPEVRVPERIVRTR